MHLKLNSLANLRRTTEHPRQRSPDEARLSVSSWLCRCCRFCCWNFPIHKASGTPKTFTISLSLTRGDNTHFLSQAEDEEEVWQVFMVVGMPIQLISLSLKFTLHYTKYKLLSLSLSKFFVFLICMSILLRYRTLRRSKGERERKVKMQAISKKWTKQYEAYYRRAQ